MWKVDLRVMGGCFEGFWWGDGGSGVWKVGVFLGVGGTTWGGF